MSEDQSVQELTTATDAGVSEMKTVVETADATSTTLTDDSNQGSKDADQISSSENVVAPKPMQQTDIDDDDLEDGEIDDDDNDDNAEAVAVEDSKAVATTPAVVAASPASKTVAQPLPGNIMAIDMLNEASKKSKPKSRKDELVEDDFAGTIERSIAAALKKDGIMPPMPKVLEAREESEKRQRVDKDKESSLSKSSRRRKRRKLRDERDKEKEKEKKKHRGSPDIAKATGIMEGEELDDDEMLCVRGGSPPPAGMMNILPQLDPSPSAKKDTYDSDDSYTSYDSYDSAPSYKRFSSRKKESNSGSSLSRSKRKERNRREDERRSEKRNRRNYEDSGAEDKYQDRHTQQPRKLELCKFYLMECCAKKEKCSYMHSDFPCKYYYLGMECVYRAACKFSHGKPLSDQLRNVLLKHLETAPKEILGTFRRISRENALNLMMATHDKICQEHGVENTISPPTNTTQSIVQTQAGMSSNTPHQHQHQQNQQNQQQSHYEIIPSLLDMVIKGSKNSNQMEMSTTTTTTSTSSNKTEKQRKSRWCDSNSMSNAVSSTVGSPGIIKKTNLEPPSSSAPSYLDLKNLTGILSTDRIDKLSKFGVVNLEQINQLTLSQLNNIGLTITEISEIQLNARNMAQLGVGVCSGVAQQQQQHSDLIHPLTSNMNVANKNVSSSVPSSQDVDMRFLPSCLPITTTTTVATSTVTTSEKSIKDTGLSSPDQSKNILSAIHQTGTNASDAANLLSSNITGIDYSQYLRDSNLGYEKNDLLDDEKDEEQLVIDDQDLDALDENSQTNEIKCDSDNESKGSNKSDDPNSTNDARLPPLFLASVDTHQGLLNEPTNSYTANLSDLTKSSKENPFKLIKSPEMKMPQFNDNSDENDIEDENNFYGSSDRSRRFNRRDRSSTEDHRDPRQHRDSKHRHGHHHHHHHQPPEPRDEYRDPRLTTTSSRLPTSSSASSKSSKSQSRWKLYGYKSSIRSDDESDRERSHSRSRSRSRSPRSRSCSPRSRSRSRTRSPTPSNYDENPTERYKAAYERPSMYDWTPKCVQEDQEYSRKHTKSDKDMRLSGFLDSSNSDIDLRLPFQPVKNIQIAKEIDGSMSTLSPIPYKIYELDIPDPKYSDLRQSFQSEDTADPRLRRILGLPELSNSKVLAALGRSSRPTIASPSSVESSSSPTRSEREKHSTITSSAQRGPRTDPRRASASATSISATATSSSYKAQVPQLPAGSPQQNMEIRLLLQKSEWYKNLNSKAKIMVNQQLALVSTELKRYHQDPSPNKVFDIQFILNNQSLQEILTCLGIYIDDNGQVAHVENDNENMMMGITGFGMPPNSGLGMDYGVGGGSGGVGGGVNSMLMMNDPSMNVQQRMAMQTQMEFLRGPPPGMNNMMGPMGGPSGTGRMYGGNMMPPYARNPRMGMGMPNVNNGGGGSGGGGGFNSFDNNGGGNKNGGMMDPNYCGSNNPFSNNFMPNGNNFGNQQMNRGNRNQNRQGGGGNSMNNGNNRNSNNQNRRMYKQNRRGGGGGGNMQSGNDKSNSGGGGMADNYNLAPSAGGNASSSSNTSKNVNTVDDVEESWDD